MIPSGRNGPRPAKVNSGGDGQTVHSTVTPGRTISREPVNSPAEYRFS